MDPRLRGDDKQRNGFSRLPGFAGRHRAIKSHFPGEKIVYLGGHGPYNSFLRFTFIESCKSAEVAALVIKGV
jgi:hypothetical protein